jgi:PIN domain nuclease of toxin-antitoxin system
LRFLLDTHVVISFLDGFVDRRFPRAGDYMRDLESTIFVSACSVWEIAIKTGLGKLDCTVPLEEIEGALREIEVEMLPITAAHAVTQLEPVPSTLDPFDRMLLA